MPTRDRPAGADSKRLEDTIAQMMKIQQEQANQMLAFQRQQSTLFSGLLSQLANQVRENPAGTPTIEETDRPSPDQLQVVP